MNDARDWFVLALVSAIWIASTVFLFIHSGDGNFGIWSGLAITICGTYHWLCIHDQKTEDKS